MLDLVASPDGVRFWIHVTPRARAERVGGSHARALRVRVGAPPVDGAANAAARDALARALGVSRAAVVLDPASRGRRKSVSVSGDPGTLTGRLRELAGPGASR